MYLNQLNQIKKELVQKNKLENSTRSRVILLKQAWLNDSTKKCEKCERKENLTLDHIVPVRIVKEFGIDEEREFMPENYRVLCKICNHYKGERLDFADRRTKELLIRFLERV